MTPLRSASEVNAAVGFERPVSGAPGRPIRDRARLGDAERTNELGWEHATSGQRITRQFDNHLLDLATACFEGLDLLGIGFVVTDPACRLLQANLTAKKILQAHDGLSLNREGVLRTGDGSSPTLAELVAKITGPQSVAGFPGGYAVAAVERPSGGRALTMFVCEPAGSPCAQGELAVPVLILNHADKPPGITVLRDTCGLTRAEVRLANLLMEGATVPECCKRLRIRRCTVAFHLKNMFRKTGTRCQSQLVSVLFRGVVWVKPGSSQPRSNRHQPPLTPGKKNGRPNSQAGKARR